MKKEEKSNLQVYAGPVIWFRREGLLLTWGKNYNNPWIGSIIKNWPKN
jgi:hypothetical protein